MRVVTERLHSKGVRHFVDERNYISVIKNRELKVPLDTHCVVTTQLVGHSCVSASYKVVLTTFLVCLCTRLVLVRYLLLHPTTSLDSDV